MRVSDVDGEAVDVSDGECHIVRAMPVLVSQSDRAVLTDQTSSFDWNDVSGVSEYEIQVDNSSDFGSPEIDRAVSQSEYASTQGPSYETYYWRVRARYSGGWGPWSSAWHFTIQGLPAAPVLVSPSNASVLTDQTPGFESNTVSGASQYQIKVDNSRNFNSPEIDRTLSGSS